MQKVIEIIEQSFLSPLLSDESISDVSYNGKDIYYFSALHGRKYFQTISVSEVFTFLRNIANHANSRFSYSDTFLDISIGKYRLSAMHYAKTRFGYEESLSFALRINHDFLQNHIDYVGIKLKGILQDIMKRGCSIVISGPTGVGKTTLQKYLLTLLPKATRVLVIDNVMELGEVSGLNTNLDLTLWQTTSNDEKEIKSFIEKALRFHPDYLIIAESRGNEMQEIVQGSLSGHPNIVTVHAQSSEQVYDRLAYLAKNNNINSLKEAFPIIIHLAKRISDNGGVERYINQIRVEVSGTTKLLYEDKKL